MTVRVHFDLVEGTTRSLDAIVKDLKDGLLTDRTVTWRSDNKALATVGETTGTVKAQAKGITAIFAKSGVVETSIFINVTQAPVVSIKITADSFEVLEGNQILLSATLRDKDGNILEGRTLAWLSSDQTVAEVSGSGLVLGLKGGPQTRITAISEEGVESGVGITVTHLPVDRISFRCGSPVAIFICGPTLSLGGTVQVVARRPSTRPNSMYPHELKDPMGRIEKPWFPPRPFYLDAGGCPVLISLKPRIHRPIRPFRRRF